LRGDFAPAGLKSRNRTLNCKFEFRTARGSARVIERRKRVTRRTNPGSAGAALGGSLRYPNGVSMHTRFSISVRAQRSIAMMHGDSRLVLRRAMLPQLKTARWGFMLLWWPKK
jgi:hypothetical protein